MPRPKLSCDWEVPNCKRTARHEVLAENRRLRVTRRSQYCDDHIEAVDTIVPAGWKITKQPIGGTDDC